MSVKRERTRRVVVRTGSDSWWIGASRAWKIMSTTRRRAAKPPPGRASLGPGVIRENVSMPANTGADYEYRMVIEQKYERYTRTYESC